MRGNSGRVLHRALGTGRRDGEVLKGMSLWRDKCWDSILAWTVASCDTEPR